MNSAETLDLLNKVKTGALTPGEAAQKLQAAPFYDLGYAKVDHHRALRQGIPEVIYAAGKTPEQIIGIITNMRGHGAENILITRLSGEAANRITNIDLYYNEIARVGIAYKTEVEKTGLIVIASGGTSDMPVCEEAALTAETFGNNVTRLYDVGVAGLHRLLSHLDILAKARVIIAVAGMEGALASVIGGLVSCPVIAVPTSVGYGANFGGLSALLSMLNSCAAGVSVVNIDNGFGAGYLASRINKM